MRSFFDRYFDDFYDLEWIPSFYKDNTIRRLELLENNQNNSLTESKSSEVVNGENDITFKVQTHGADKDDVSVVYDKDKNTLKISVKSNKSYSTDKDVAEKKGHNENSKFYYSYESTYTLPENAEPDKIAARIKDGYLNIVVPKKVEEKKEENVKKITIE